MNIEILSIGNEILSGRTINTNAAFISKRLKDLGYETAHHSVVADSKKEIVSSLKHSFKRASLIILTGGLGPTMDDITKKVICDYLDLDLKFNEEIASDIESRFGQIASLEEQSHVPKKATIFKNSVGTAPGFAYISSGTAVITLPGVPVEMKEMFSLSVIPYILKHFPLKEKVFQENLNFYLLEEVRLNSFIESLKIDKDISVGIYPSHGIVQVSLSCKGKTQKEAKEKIFSVEKALVKEFALNIFPSESGKIEEALHEIFLLKNIKLAIAESCSGGALAAKLTSVPGASYFFLGSIVSYSNEMKKKVLNVSEKTLKQKGAVSCETVKEMIDGLFSITQADYAIAVSGIAGPSGGSEDKPVGTVCIGVGKRDEDIDLHTFNFPGNREVIIEFTINYAMAILYKRIAHNKFYKDL